LKILRFGAVFMFGGFLQFSGCLSYAGELGDTVFNDLNANGVHEANEPGLGGVTIFLEDCSGAVQANVTSAADGSYSFVGLIAGSYRLRVVAPSGYAISPVSQQGNWAVDSDFDPVTGYAMCRPLGATQTRRAIDAGLYSTGPQGTALFGDRIWSDLNGNGLMDPNEPGLVGVELTLTQCDGTVIASTLTSTDGAWVFDDLPAGSYEVRMRIPPGYRVSPLGVGNWSMNNDFEANGIMACRTLADGQTSRGADGGLVPTATGSGVMGNFVWNDQNQNGLQDGGEPGLGGVTVDLQSCDGTVVASTVTSGTGSFVFANLPPEQYRIRISPPSGFALTTQGSGANYAIDSDFDPATGLSGCRALAANQSRLAIDAGLFATSTTAGEVVCPGGGTAYLGDWIWEDTNGDGIQQRSVEPSIGGIEVRLYECSGTPQTGCQCDSTPICTSTSTADGIFGFSGLAPGPYQLRITVAGTPYRGGPTHVVSHDIDNDFGNHFNDGDVVGYCKVMAAGQRRPGSDAGLVPR